MDLHNNVVEIETLILLEGLMAIETLKKYRLVGGTALALLKGHRYSDDIDLFTDRQTSTTTLAATMKNNFKDNISRISIMPFGITCYYNNHEKNHYVKIDIMHYHNDPFLDPPLTVDGIRIASMNDIAAMKCNAVKGRYNKKDFIDLYTLLEDMGFSQMLACNAKRFKYEDIRDTLVAIANIDKANSDQMPKMLNGTTWETVKTKLKAEAKLFCKSIRQRQNDHYKDKGLEM
jgi:predicted nucleotidyltransferase component of viral defense system